MASPHTPASFRRYSMVRRVGTLGMCDLWHVVSVNHAQPPRSALLYRLKSEVAAASRLKRSFIGAGRHSQRLRHPNIAITEEVLIEGNELGIVTEPMVGVSVCRIVEQVRSCSNSIPVWFAIHIARQICAALRYAHSMCDAAGHPDPIYHGSLSSRRVRITPAGEVKIFDFELGNFLSDWSAVPCQKLGAAESRELSSVAASCHKTPMQHDVACVAEVLYELLTLSAPDNPTPSVQATAAAARFLVPPSRRASWVSRQLDDVVRRALTAEPSDAFHEIAEFDAALQACCDGRDESVQSDHVAAFVDLISQSDKFADTPTSSGSHDERTYHDGAIGSLSNQPDDPEVAVTECLLESDTPTALGWSAVTLSRTAGADLPEGRIESSSSSQARTHPDLDDPLAVEPCERQADASAANSREEAILHFERGLEFLRMGELAEAGEAWRTTLSLDPAHRAACTNLRLLQKRLHREI